ncbi:hypothetical protein H4219_004003 [Mycoemilia scoparia]|uniref:Uncharacterized protein n=1 Tax=Mycoemilia scoparia TaxID=417184 RepID=A0A9W7ZTX4_9FUNG|nr:hypothetical protein H4219_004003 [Mycoemilia scoparia]
MEEPKKDTKSLHHDPDPNPSGQLDWSEVPNALALNRLNGESISNYAQKVCSICLSLHAEAEETPIDERSMVNFFRPSIMREYHIIYLLKYINIYESLSTDENKSQVAKTLRDDLQDVFKKQPDICGFLIANEHEDLGDDKELVAIFNHLLRKYKRSGGVTAYFASQDEHYSEVHSHFLESDSESKLYKSMLKAYLNNPTFHVNQILSQIQNDPSISSSDKIKMAMEKYIHYCIDTLYDMAFSRSTAIKFACYSNKDIQYTTSHRELYKEHSDITRLLNQFNEGLSTFYHRFKEFLNEQKKAKCTSNKAHYQPFVVGEILMKLYEKDEEMDIASSEYITAGQIVRICNMIFIETNYEVVMDEMTEENNIGMPLFNNGYARVLLKVKGTDEVKGEIILDLLNPQTQEHCVFFDTVWTAREMVVSPQGKTVRCHPIVRVRSNFVSTKETPHIYIGYQDAVNLAGTLGLAFATVLSNSKYGLPAEPSTISDLDVVPKHMFEAIMMKKDILMGFKNPETGKSMPEKLANTLIKEHQSHCISNLIIRTQLSIIGLELHDPELCADYSVSERLNELIPEFRDLHFQSKIRYINDLFKDDTNEIYQKAMQIITGYSLAQTYLLYALGEEFSKNGPLCMDILPNLVNLTDLSDEASRTNIMLDMLEDFIGKKISAKDALRTFGIY